MMLRLLKLRKLPPYNSQFASSGITSNLMTKTCAFCNHSFVLKSPKESEFLPTGFIRNQSTSTRTIVQNNVTKKKKKKNKRKYAELLEVTEDSSSQKKASVCRLTSKHLTLLTEQPNINLSQLYNLKKLAMSQSKNASQSDGQYEQSAMVFIPKGLDFQSARQRVTESLKVITPKDFQRTIVPSRENTSECDNQEMLMADSSHIQELDLSVDDPELQSKLLEELDAEPDHQGQTYKDDIEEHHEFNETDFETVHSEVLPVHIVRKVTNTVHAPASKLRKKQKELLVKTDSKELDQASREESLACNLFSYLDLCVNCGLLNRGLSTLNFYRSRSKTVKYIPKPVDIKLFNILLHGFAAKSNLNKVMEILHHIEEDRIKWSLQTFAACMECIGRLPETPSNVSLLKTWFVKLEERGWTPNDVIVKGTYVADQKEMVLKSIRFVLPHFEPEFPPPDRCYSCSLLQELNKTSEDWVPKSPMDGVVAQFNLNEGIKEQLQTESRNDIHVKSIEKKNEPSATIQHFRKKLEDSQSVWRKAATNAFLRELEVLRVQQRSLRSFRSLDLYPYLCALPPEEYVDIILKEIRKLAEGSETFSPTTTQLYRELAEKIQARYEVRYKREVGILSKVEHLYEEYCQWFLNPQGPAQNTREKWQLLVHSCREGPDLYAGEKYWSPLVLNTLGKFLYSIILRDIKIDINIIRHNCNTEHLLPAFYTLFRNHGRHLKEEIKPHPALVRLYRSASLEDLIFDVTLVPMLSPPMPWVQATNAGGYILSHTNLMRLPHQAFQQRHRLKEVPVNQLYPALDALNQLGTVPWIVNQPILDVVMEVFNNGGSARLDIPQPPSACGAPPPVTPEMSKLERFNNFRQRLAVRRRRAEMYSLWCDALYRLSLANYFRHKVFWLPHNMDFRGRVYPCPPHLNHLGSDMARALLKFAKGQALGPNGLDWIKIHLVNLTGLAKREPIEKRLEFANNILPDILDSADRPLTGNMWWAQSDEPWQTLACCMEVASALRSGDPEKYLSHFPVHQDGSCNGLQHYAALGRDLAGAQSVNLTPSQSPQDVYSCVAALVEQLRMKDAAEGNKVAQVLEGFVQRKVIKQTVMTTVYGVTRYGARLQIARQLKDIEHFPKDYVWQASMYLVVKTFESLREMFTSTKEIQDWFTDCARLISQVCGQNVEWVTPLGLPIVQPYNRINRKPEPHNRALHEQLVLDMFERPNVMKQKNAFPPNFIHSLDSSHMMLTSLFCDRAGITFVSVHDCFWTHANTVSVMNKICREQFVALHSEPILENLSRYLVEKYSYPESEIGNTNSTVNATKSALNSVLKTLPSTGDFNLNSVLASVYFFS